MILLNGKELTFEVFPNGETKVNGQEINYSNRTYFLDRTDEITLKYENDSDLIKLMFVKKQLNKISQKASLRILYMPYSRMDRVEGDSVFTLKYVSEFINSLNFESITILEPHSDVSMALLNKSHAVYPTIELVKDVIKEVDFDLEKDYIFFPDAGAQKRYSKFFNFKNQLTAFKERDFETGYIKSLQVIGDVKEKGFKLIIVDDLCSRGGTFILSAKELKKIGANEIYLVVTHCENTIYDGEIPNSDLITKVFTTNSIISESKNDKIKINNILGGIQ